MKLQILPAILLSGALAGMAVPVQAKDIRIGLQAELNSLDPHYFLAGANLEFAHNLFSNLLKLDKNLQLVPDLAVSYEQAAPDTWVFRLRDDAAFTDGLPVTADDVVFSFERAENLPNSPGSFRTFTRGKTLTALDDHTVQIQTEGPNSSVPFDVSFPPVISRKHGEGVTTADFNARQGLVGSGPYTLAEYAPGDHMTLKAKADYWGEKPVYDTVTLRWLPNGSARVAALLAGDVDLIVSVPRTDIERIRQSEDLHLGEATADRSMYLVPRQVDQTPYITDASGSPLPANPLRDVKVRKAINLAIDRTLLSDRILGGTAEAAGQLMPKGFAGYLEDLPVPRRDVEQVKQLLTEAGYPEGFNITLHCHSGRYEGAEQVCLGIAQMMTQAGIRTETVIEPYNVFSTRYANNDFALAFYGTANPFGDMSLALSSLLHSKGPLNRTAEGYPEMDALADEMQRAPGMKERLAAMEKASRLEDEKMLFIPLYHPKYFWAWRTGFDFEPQVSGQTSWLGFKAAE